MKNPDDVLYDLLRTKLPGNHLRQACIEIARFKDSGVHYGVHSEAVFTQSRKTAWDAATGFEPRKVAAERGKEKSPPINDRTG